MLIVHKLHKLFKLGNMNRLFETFLLLMIFSSFIYGRGNTRVVNLRCDNMENPIVIESRQPILQWQLVSDQRGKGKRPIVLWYPAV